MFFEIDELERAVFAPNRKVDARTEQVQKLFIRRNDRRISKGVLEDVHCALGVGQGHAVNLGHAPDEDAFDEGIGKADGYRS